MDVLFLTTVLPGGVRSGGEIVSQNLIDALLAAGRDTCVVGYRRPGDDSPVRGGERCVGTRPIESSTAPVRSLAWMARALTTRSPYSVVKFRSRNYRKTAELAWAQQPAAVIVDHAQTLSPVRGRGPAAPFVFVAHNVESDSYEALAASANRPVLRWLNAREARLIRGVELELVRQAQQVWTLTEADAAHFRSAYPTADVRTLEVSSRIATVPTAEPISHDVGLIGRWDWEANALGLRWFGSEILPRLPADLRVEIAGAGAEWLRGRHPNVVVRGIVPDAQRFLTQSRVVAVPAVTGSGVQIKTLDAIASGRPIVATPTAVRGISQPPRSVDVAETAADFAGRLVAVAQDSSRQRPDAEAYVWTAARRNRFNRRVADWIDELSSP